MATNPSKFQLRLLSTTKTFLKNMSFDGETIKSSGTIELFGITLDKYNSFKRHIQIFVTKQITKPKLFYV